MNKEEALLKAKEMCPIDVSDEKYYTGLFITLRALQYPLKDTIQITLSEVRKNNGVIDYNFLYDIEEKANENNPTVSPFLVTKDFSKEMEEQIGKPKSNLGNLLWVETMVHLKGTANKTLFLSILKEVKAAIINNMRT